MGDKYPWSKLDDDQIQPGLDPRNFRNDYITQRTWDDYWYNNPHGGLFSPSPQKPLPTPWVGFSAGRPETGVEAAKERYRNGPISIASKEVFVNDVKQKEGKKTPEQIGLLTLTNIGGRELTKISRHNEISGINQEYSPIANLADISLQYSPLAISPNADNVSSFLSTFNLDITKYIPTQEELEEYYPLEADVDKRKIILFDKETNSLIVHVKNIFTNEKIEVEFIVPSEVKDGTIYT